MADVIKHRGNVIVDSVKTRPVLVEIQNNDVGFKYNISCKNASNPNVQVLPVDQEDMVTYQSPPVLEKLIEKPENRDVTPDDVIDIDKPYGSFYQYSDYSWDIFKYLRELEEESAFDAGLIRRQKEVTIGARKILINWIIQINSNFNLHDETLHLTISMIDRHLQNETVELNKFQLLGVACLFIAAKYEDGYSIRVSNLVYLTGNTYTRNQILDMEIIVLKSLDFRVDRPLALHFLTRYSKAADSKIKCASLAKYLIEMSLFDLKLSCRSPSLIAAASLYVASKVWDLNFKWNGQMEYYSSYLEDDLMPSVLRLRDCYKTFNFKNYPTLPQKYSQRKYYQVSIIPGLDILIKNM